ncbi:MAG: hypothetical protein HWD59_01860 [Coxiellaceae bacterium]|nr:MAG: hypothetical protein HWD59_01860 [Coxiellaceae bacterium]
MVATIAKINLLPPYLIDQSMGQYRSRWSWALAIMMLVSLSFIIDLTIKQAIFRSQQQQQRLQMALHQIQVTEQQRDVVRQQFQTMLAFLTKQQSRQSTAQTAQHFCSNYQLCCQQMLI